MLDRRTMAYLATDADGSGPWIYAVDVERRIAHRISSGLESYTSLAASASGMRLAATIASSRASIWRMSLTLDGTADTTASAPSLVLTNGVAPRLGPDFMLYVSWRGDRQGIWSLTHGTRREVWSSGQSRVVGGPASSPDGRRIAITSLHSGKFGFYQRAADGSGSEDLLLEENSYVKYVNDWSPDGKFLVFQQAPRGTNEIWVLPLAGERKPFPLLQAQSPAIGSAVSPNGKWLSYCSSESGEQKIYVVSFPGPGGKWQVSAGGGCYPRWRRDGKELFYLSVDNKIMAAEVRGDASSFAVGTLNPLFETRVYRSASGGFDVTADGQRFIVAYEPGQPNVAITLVENWDAELKKK